MPSETWWQRYERLRSDLLHKADAHGFACANRNVTEADRRTRHHDLQDALAALDAHVRGLVEERGADALRLARRLANATPPSLDYPNGYTRLAERFHAILTDAAAVADTQTPTEG